MRISIIFSNLVAAVAEPGPSALGRFGGRGGGSVAWNGRKKRNSRLKCENRALPFYCLAYLEIGKKGRDFFLDDEATLRRKKRNLDLTRHKREVGPGKKIYLF